MKRIILLLTIALMGVMSVQAQVSDCRTCEGKGVILCPDCNGNPPMCTVCKGLGNIICRRCNGEFQTCPLCHGSKYYNGPCSVCHATGRIIDCKECDGKGYVKCPEIPNNCYMGNQVCQRCKGINKIPCPDCQ